MASTEALRKAMPAWSSTAYFEAFAPMRSATAAIASGMADVMNPFAEVFRSKWSWTPPSGFDAMARDWAAVARDVRRATEKLAEEAAVHPQQQRLFDPS